MFLADPADPIFIFGDLNIDLSDNKANDLTEFMRLFSLNNFIKEKTRTSQIYLKKQQIFKTTSSLIDVLLHNQNMITDTSVFGCPFSDHCFIAAKLNLKQIKENKTSFNGRLLSEHNLESIINQLEKTDFSLDCSTLGVNELWLQIKSLILDATNNIAPLKDIKLKKRDFFPWVDSELIELKQCRDHLFNLKQSTKSPNDLAKYKEYRTAYQSLNRNKMIDYFKNMKLSDFKN